MTARGSHILVLYHGSEKADRRLGELARLGAERGGRLTVLALAVEEPTSRRCCDTRSVLWNKVQREFATDDLARARDVVGGAEQVEFDVLAHGGRGVAAAVADEARRRGADAIVMAHPGSCGLTRRERRRLQAESPVPLTA